MDGEEDSRAQSVDRMESIQSRRAIIISFVLFRTIRVAGRVDL